ncbi:MAG: hypothetical protein NTY42_02940 [Planctomycetota bacterium]|nr:hypothetical protein [Planctomycetota bacterium]
MAFHSRDGMDEFAKENDAAVGDQHPPAESLLKLILHRFLGL